jgi:hypothetical protein
MKMDRKITLRVLFEVSLAGLLTGCTISPKENMARSTTEYNLVVEKTQNEMLLLNIVRASKRRPMYFTSLSSLKGSKTYEFQTGSISLPFGKIGTGLNGAYSIAPSARYSTNPIFDLTVLDTKEFTCGIMTPVSMTTIEYYWQQGWPKEMLLYLFIKRIEVKTADGNMVLDNYPDNKTEFRNFQNWLETVNWDIKEKHVPAIPIAEMDANEVSQLRRAVEILRLVSNKSEDNKELQLVRREYKFIPTAKKGGQPLECDIYLRSPEAILYYLGEILRVENRPEDPNTPMIHVGHGQSATSLARLFYARKATDDDTAPDVSVDYEGTKYVIPGNPDSDDGYCVDRSMHVLSLVSQLIGLQKKSEQAPVTGVVSVIGR